LTNGNDKESVSAFLKHAEEILETAGQGSGEDLRLSILVGRDGAIRMVAGSDWELEPLRMHHGARSAYRVTRRAGCVQLEGRSDEGACVLRSGPAAGAGFLWNDFPRYQLV
jgi:hypothetical protein